MLRILGIDPGVYFMGWSILEIVDGNITLISAGVIKVYGSIISDRLLFIHNAICNLVIKYGPSHAAVEIIFLNKNPASSFKLECIRGAILLSCLLMKLNIAEYHACKVKEMVVGYGHANKQQICYIIDKILGPLCVKGKSDDVYDACAIAMCHAYTIKLKIF